MKRVLGQRMRDDDDGFPLPRGLPIPLHIYTSMGVKRRPPRGRAPPGQEEEKGKKEEDVVQNPVSFTVRE